MDRQVSKSFPYEIRTGNVHQRSPSIEFFEKGCLPEGLLQVPSFFWFSSPGTHEFIYEESVPMPYLDAVLTVITLPFDADKDDKWLDDDSW